MHLNVDKCNMDRTTHIPAELFQSVVHLNHATATDSHDMSNVHDKLALASAV